MMVILSYVIHTIDVPHFACQHIEAGVYMSTQHSMYWQKWLTSNAVLSGLRRESEGRGFNPLPLISIRAKLLKPYLSASTGLSEHCTCIQTLQRLPKPFNEVNMSKGLTDQRMMSIASAQSRAAGSRNTLFCCSFLFVDSAFAVSLQIHDWHKHVCSKMHCLWTPLMSPEDTKCKLIDCVPSRGGQAVRLAGECLPRHTSACPGSCSTCLPVQSSFSPPYLSHAQKSATNKAL